MGKQPRQFRSLITALRRAPLLAVLVGVLALVVVGCAGEQAAEKPAAKKQRVLQAPAEPRKSAPTSASESDVATSADVPGQPEVASSDGQAVSSTDDSKPAPAPVRRLTGTMVRLGVPHDLRIDRALAMIDTNALPPGIQSILRANDILAGEIALADVAAFQEALGSVVNATQRRLLGLRDLTPVPFGDGRKHSTQVVLARPDNGATSAQPMRLPAGQPQLLIRATPGDEQTVDLELVPHFFFPKFSLFPRQPQEKALDGRVFSELTLSSVVTADRLIVLTSIQAPLPVDVEPQTGAGEAATADQEVLEGTPAGVAAQREASGPPTIGQLFFTGQLMQRPIRYILIVGVRDADPGEHRQLEGK